MCARRGWCGNPYEEWWASGKEESVMNHQNAPARWEAWKTAEETLDLMEESRRKRAKLFAPLIESYVRSRKIALEIVTYLLEESVRRPLKDWEGRLRGERAEDAIRAELKIEELRC